MRAQIARDERKGRCLIATEKIQRGDLIDSAPVVVLTAEQAHELDDGPLYNYYLRWDGDIANGGRSAIAFGLVSFCNHSQEPNAVVVPNYDAETSELYALRNIESGTEITIKYCEIWFEVVDNTHIPEKVRSWHPMMLSRS